MVQSPSRPGGRLVRASVDEDWCNKGRRFTKNWGNAGWLVTGECQVVRRKVCLLDIIKEREFSMR